MYGLSLDVNLLKSLTEPVGAKAPAFSTDALSQTISRKDGQGFALLCLAQAYPVPMFRYGCKKISRLIYNLLKTTYSVVSKKTSNPNIGFIWNSFLGICRYFIIYV